MPMLSITVFASEVDNITIIGSTGTVEGDAKQDAPKGADPSVKSEPPVNDEPPANNEPPESGNPEGSKDVNVPGGGSNNKQDVISTPESVENPAAGTKAPLAEAEEAIETDEEIPELEIEEAEAFGVTISGYVVSYNPGIATTIELIRDGEVKYSTVIEAEEGSGQVTQSYSFTEVEAGIYALKITKKAHLSYSMMTLNVDEDDVTFFEVTLKPGDLNGDGKIDLADIYILINGYGESGGNMINAAADINGDEIVDEADLSILMDVLGTEETIDP
jgi:hypothetical protein